MRSHLCCEVDRQGVRSTEQAGLVDEVIVAPLVLSIEEHFLVRHDVRLALRSVEDEVAPVLRGRSSRSSQHGTSRSGRRSDCRSHTSIFVAEDFLECHFVRLVLRLLVCVIFRSDRLVDEVIVFPLVLFVERDFLARHDVCLVLLLLCGRTNIVVLILSLVRADEVLVLEVVQRGDARSRH